MSSSPLSDPGDRATKLAALDGPFARELTGLDLADIAASSDSMLIVDEALIIRGYNRAYVEFACTNGQPDIESRYGVGSSLLAAISEPAWSFYARAFHRVLDRREVLHQCYTCSSPDEHRDFRLSAYPLPHGSGLLLCHHLVSAAPVPGGEHVARSLDHLSPDDLIIQCCHCRKVRNFQRGNRWDWVPELVEQRPSNVSHTFCPRCLDHYFPIVGAE